MNVVFLSPHFPPNFFSFCVALKAAGANVLGVADAAYDTLRPELRAALAEYYKVADMERYDDLLRALGHLTSKQGKLDRLDSLSEHWLEAEARLREDFNIRGLRPAEMPRIRRKSEMKKVFRRAGVRAARGRVCAEAEATRALVRELGYPVVAKPDVGVGAAGTYRIDGEAQLERYLSSKPPVDYIVEEFVDGDIVTYDGLADREGQVVFEASLRYSRGVMEVVNEDTDIWYHAVREIPSDLRETGGRLVEAFGIRERFFHFEFFRLADQGLVALEVNARPPGGLTLDMWNYQNDGDIYSSWADLLVAGRTAPPPPRAYFCAYVGRKSRFSYALDPGAIRARFGSMVMRQERIDDVFSAAIGNYGVVLRSADLADLEQAAAAIQQRA